MSMMDSLFNKGFKATQCKTLLKLAIPRIKLLRNRREIQMKQMRREIAKLLETGQEASARIRVEHILREEKMMAAQEIIELFCELISVRLPIIEVQRECPLDLKEAISSICFAAPRCADVTELVQVQMLFAGKYGKEFVAAATELMPECGVNRQLIELLSVRAPGPDVKLKLLKEIALEHELEWDPSVSETELLKPHEDLLNGPTQFVSGSKVPLPKAKCDETMYSASSSVSKEVPGKRSESDDEFEFLDLPGVPRQPLQSSADREVGKDAGGNEIASNKPKMESGEVLLGKSVTECKSPAQKEGEKFLTFTVPPPKSFMSHSLEQSNPSSSISKTQRESNVDLKDVLAAAQAAAESAESAAAAARSAAILAQLKISELTKKQNDEVPVSPVDNPFHADTQKACNSASSQYINQMKHPSYDDASTGSNNHILGQDQKCHEPQRLPSIDDETYFSYPNLFTSQGSNLSSRAQPFNSSSVPR
ncbi:IST1 homolog [Ipomoea triloba]|uniref:IST1 homolog n=1 Tax=Ipomoea triloba TaxID=35885 RepID=UPI00125CDDEB|nr:IST1 homolog [Ipomoea triloba]